MLLILPGVIVNYWPLLGVKAGKRLAPLNLIVAEKEEVVYAYVGF